jgi:hypothetical protein
VTACSSGKTCASNEGEDASEGARICGADPSRDNNHAVHNHARRTSTHGAHHLGHKSDTVAERLRQRTEVDQAVAHNGFGAPRLCKRLGLRTWPTKERLLISGKFGIEGVQRN